MLARIVSNKWIYLDNVTDHEDRCLNKYFSVKHPKAMFINDTSQQSWDGWYRKYDSRNQRLSRALLDELKKLASKQKLPLTIADRRPQDDYAPFDPKEIKPDILEGITLEDHQIRIIEACQQNEVGIIKAPTGAGKTEAIAAITKLYDLPTVIIANQRVVIEQIKKRLELRDVAGGEIGLFYGGVRPNGQTVVVGSIQSLMSPPTSLKKKNFQQWKSRNQNAKIFQQIVKQSKLLIVDEADVATDKQYRKLFKSYFKGRYKYGFTATPFDPDKPVEAMILKEHIGSVIVEVSRKELEEIGRIIPIKAYMVGVGESGDKYDRTAYDIAQRELVIENPSYHQKVKSIVDAFPDDKTMILVDTHNISELGLALMEAIPNSIFIYGKSTKKTRNDAIKAFEDGEIKCLIGGKILKRGLDVKGGMHNLIICGGGKLSSDFNQKIGRAVRNNDRGWARLFCFFHLDNHYLYTHSKKQLKTILSLDYEVTVTAYGKSIDGKDLVKRNFRFPKKK